MAQVLRPFAERVHRHAGGSVPNSHPSPAARRYDIAPDADGDGRGGQRRTRQPEQHVPGDGLPHHCALHAKGGQAVAMGERNNTHSRALLATRRPDQRPQPLSGLRVPRRRQAVAAHRRDDGAPGEHGDARDPVRVREVVQLLARGRLRDDGLAVEARGNDASAIGEDGRAGDRGAVRADRAELFARARVPHSGPRVLPPSQQAVAGRKHLHIRDEAEEAAATDLERMPDRPQLGARRGVPDRGRAVHAARDDAVAARKDPGALHRPVVAQVVQRLARRRVPNLGTTVLVPRQRPVPEGEELHPGESRGLAPDGATAAARLP
mmetsp:Transcript_16550/g.48011  ORF Transcript_16550/g.48011 Transcript_16550/m.48011 type:complete len:322 (-) Transcript_16550:317-1282(-)